MVKNVVNSIVVEPKQKRGRKPKNAAAALENKVLDENSEKDNNIQKFFKLMLQKTITCNIKNADDKTWSGTAIIEIL